MVITIHFLSIGTAHINVSFTTQDALRHLVSIHIEAETLESEGVYIIQVRACVGAYEVTNCTTHCRTKFIGQQLKRDPVRRGD
jgi:hypothetical protein